MKKYIVHMVILMLALLVIGRAHAVELEESNEPSAAVVNGVRIPIA